EAKPIAMITEGTRINTGKTDETEPKVFADSKKEVLKTRELAIADFNFKDVDRFRTFYNIAKESGRKLVISFRHACFLERYHKDKNLNVPDSKDANIMLLKPKRMTGTYCDEDYCDNNIKDRLNYPNIIVAEDIAKNPSKYLVVLNFWYFNTLIDMQSKGTYIHSLSEPFNEEMELSYGRMKNWLGYFGLNFFQSHCSGHICGADMKELIKEINAKELFPVHTEHPELFKKLSDKVNMIEEGKEYFL
ncbi:MAG: MBL fold metallo-hydrolase, partial [Nanoarchaeota archaeon]|nr:MBL fold metallo-hydrolase [Nanoarchaeota archaeon]